MIYTFTKHDNQWCIKVKLKSTDPIPQAGDSVTVEKSNGKTTEAVLGSMITTNSWGELIFEKIDSKPSEAVEFKNMIGLSDKDWRKFKKGVAKYNKKHDDKIVLAFAENGPNGEIAYLIFDSGERLNAPLKELL